MSQRSVIRGRGALRDPWRGLMEQCLRAIAFNLS